MTNNNLVALVTGGNAGIGFHLVAQLARAGVRVVLASRDPARGAAAAADLAKDGLDVDTVTLDVTDDQSIVAAARQVADTYGGLDLLINNAAIAGDGLPPSQVTREQMLQIFDTNTAGVAAVINAFLPVLRAAERARILNVSSELGSARLISDPRWPFSNVAATAYQVSKAALDLLTVMYAKELEPDKISVVSVSPGYRATGLSNGRPTPGAGDPADGAAGIVGVALAQELPTGQFFDDHGEVVAW